MIISRSYKFSKMSKNKIPGLVNIYLNNIKIINKAENQKFKLEKIFTLGFKNRILINKDKKIRYFLTIFVR